MTEIITNPTREQLRSLFDIAGRAANGKGRTRTLDVDGLSADTFASLVLSGQAGCEQWDGGGVANSYGYRAGTSVIAFAWYTRPDGVKVVRVCADRVSTSGRHVSSLNLGTRTQQAKLADACPAALVHRELLAVYNGMVPGTEGFVKRIKKDPTDATNWLVLADWLNDQDRGTDYREPVSYRSLPVPDADLATLIRSAFAAPVTA